MTFSPTQGADLTAFGFHVFAVVGYEKDDPMFRVGDGEPVARSAYGVVVFGSESKVQSAITAASSTAIVHPGGAARDGDFLQAELRRPAGAKPGREWPIGR
jgi:hypothetical protein